MKRAFKQKAIRSELFSTSLVCSENVRDGFANDVCTLQARCSQAANKLRSWNHICFTLIDFILLHIIQSMYFRIFCVWTNGVSLFSLRVDDQRLNVCRNNGSRTRRRNDCEGNFDSWRMGSRVLLCELESRNVMQEWKSVGDHWTPRLWHQLWQSNHGKLSENFKRRLPLGQTKYWRQQLSLCSDN